MQTELRAQTNSTVWLFIDWRFHALAFAKNMKIKLCWVLEKQIILDGLRHNCRQRFSANPHEYHSLRKLSLATQHRHQRYWITRFFSDSICNYELARLDTVTTASTFFFVLRKKVMEKLIKSTLGRVIHWATFSFASMQLQRCCEGSEKRREVSASVLGLGVGV